MPPLPPTGGGRGESAALVAVAPAAQPTGRPTAGPTAAPRPVPAGRQSYERLEQEGLEAQFKTYAGMGHSACPQELQEIKSFIATRLA